MTVYLAQVQGWTDTQVVGVFATEAAAMAAAEAHLENYGLADYDYSAVVKEYSVQG